MSVLNPSSDEEPLECPLCMELLELDDISFYPCSCGYQICRFCWNKIRTEGNGNCPACRSAYSENPADFKPLTVEEISKIKAEKRQKDQAKKMKISENRKHLANVRVVQKNLVFVVGLSSRLSDPEVLKRQEYFGKFGKMHKVVINTSTAYAGNQNQGPSASAYVTYYRSDDALRAIQAVSNIYIDGRTLKASLGTTKYCSHFMKNQACPKPDCMYLHELGDEAASFTKEEMQQGKHTDYERSLHEEVLLNHGAGAGDIGSNPNHDDENRTGFSASNRGNSSPTAERVLQQELIDGGEGKNCSNGTKSPTPPPNNANGASEGEVASSRTPSPKAGKTHNSVSCGSVGSAASSSNDSSLCSNGSSSSCWPNLRNGDNNSSGFINTDNPNHLRSNFTTDLLHHHGQTLTTEKSLLSGNGVRTRNCLDVNNVGIHENVVNETDHCDLGTTDWRTNLTEPPLSLSKEEVFAEDDLGFDPFHETQKALAEMLESESRVVNTQASSCTSAGFSHSWNSSASVTSPSNSSMLGLLPSRSSASIPPGLSATGTVVTNRPKQPPPGFNIVDFSNGLGQSPSPAVPSLISPDVQSFANYDGFSSSDIGSSNQSNIGVFGNVPFSNGRENDFGFSNEANSSISDNFGTSRNISVMGFNGGRNQSGDGGRLPPQMQLLPPSTNERNGDHGLDPLQHHYRHMAIEKQHNYLNGSSSNQTKDWQDGFRALLPNVNVSFGTLPQQQQQQQQSQLTHLLDNIVDSGNGGRFNNLSTCNSSTVLNDPRHGPSLNHQHNHLNHMERSHPVRQQQNLRHNSGWNVMGNVEGVNDWTVLDPAIVGGQLSDNQQQNHQNVRSDSPPHWIKANLEQLTSDTPSNVNVPSSSSSHIGGSFNIGSLLPAAFNLSLSPPPGSVPSQQGTNGGVGLAGWTQPLLANTPPPGFSLNRTTAQLPQQQPPLHPFQSLTNATAGNLGSGASTNDQLESEFHRLIHSK